MPHREAIATDRLTALGDLVREHLPEAVKHQDEPLLRGMLFPHDDYFLISETEKWLMEGCRREEVGRVRDELEKKGVGQSDVARALEVHETTAWRILERGTGSARQWDRLLAIFRDKLTDLKPASPDDKFISGYCNAVEQLRRHVCAIVGRECCSITRREFCFLWHASMDTTWLKGKRDLDLDCMNRAATSIHRKVQTEFPMDAAATSMSAEQISILEKEWRFWFAVVFLVRPPHFADWPVHLFVPVKETQT